MDIQTLASLPPQVLAAYLRDPQTALMSGMVKEGTDTSPVQSPWEGVARMVKAGIGAYQGGKLEGDYLKQGNDISDQRNQAMALALGKPAETQNYGDGTTINWNEQKPNYAAAAGALGPGNQDLGDKIFGAASAERAQQAGFGQQKSLQDAMLAAEDRRQAAGFGQQKEMSHEQLANQMELEKFKLGIDPEKQLLAQFLRGGPTGPQPADSGPAAPYMTPTPGASPSLPMADGQPQSGGMSLPGSTEVPKGNPPSMPTVPAMNASALAQPPQGGIPAPPSPNQLPGGPTVGQVTQPQQAPTVGQVTGAGSPAPYFLGKAFGVPPGLVIGPDGQVRADPLMAQQKAAESAATKTGDNLADAHKTLDIMRSNLPQVMQRFKEMSDAAKDADYGVLADNNNTGGLQKLHKQTGGKEARANAILAQRAAQGILPELGPQLAQAGIRGNKFLETLSSNASGLDLTLDPGSKEAIIHGLGEQFVKNLLSTRHTVESMGGQAPDELSIAKEISQNVPPGIQISIVNPKGIPGTIDATHLADLVAKGGRIAQ